MQEESVYLVLGCHGRTEDGFSFCPSVENRILRLDESLVYIDEIWDYLEGVQLIDKPMIDTNAIRNLLHRMQDRFDQKIKKLWSEKEFHMLERFVLMHKACGLYAKLVISSQDVVVNEEPEVISIRGTHQAPAKPTIVRTSRFR